MIKVETPPKYLCRVTLPELINLDEEGNFLPHRRQTMDVYGQTVPLVHPSELKKVVDFFYNDFWDPTKFPQFILLIFWGERLHQLGRHEALGVLKKHGEHFAVANINALKSAMIFDIHGQRNPYDSYAKFSYKYSGKEYQITAPLPSSSPVL